MASDEEIAKHLQAQFDEENELSKKQDMTDAAFAQKLASSSHKLSDSESDKDTDVELESTVASGACLHTNDAPSTSYLQNIIKNSKQSTGDNNKSPSKGGKSKRPVCKYGSTCYRKNPIHLAEFYHPTKGDKSSTPDPEPKRKKTDSNVSPLPRATSSTKSSSPMPRTASSTNKFPSMPRSASSTKSPSSKRKKTFAERHADSSPFYFFLNKIADIKKTHDDPTGLVLPDLLSPGLGELVESAQLNFMVDLDLVMDTYKAMGVGDKPLLIMYGQLSGDPSKYANLTCTEVKLPFLYGTHHTKMMFLQYKDGLRVVVHTANLTNDDWYEKTQGYWVSPHFPLLENGKSGILEGESETLFKRDLVEYIISYKSPDLTRWSHILKKYDFSKCNVVFVGSTPGYHTTAAKDKWGHMKVRKTLKQHCAGWKPSSSQPIIAQCSSIGSLGKDSKWVEGEFGASLSGGMDTSGFNATVHLIYPSEDDVRWSIQGYSGGSCLPYNSNTHNKQLWLNRCLHNWRSERKNRSKSMPHIKSYTRMSKSFSTSQYFIVTSSNLSKAAWGQLQKQNTQLFIRSYEVGVLFLPKFLVNTDAFELGGESKFTLPYDLPLTKYPGDAKPWFMDTRKSTPDVMGNKYG